MAKTPLSEMERVGRKVSKILSDITTKMDAIKASDQLQPFQVPEFGDLNKDLDKQFAQVEKLKKVWKTYGENMEKVVKRKLQANKLIIESDQKLEKIEAKLHDLNEKEARLAKKNRKLSHEEILTRKELLIIKTKTEKIKKEAEAFDEKAYKKQAFRHAALEKGVGMLQSGLQAASKIGFSIIAAGFEYMADTMKTIYDMANKFQSAMAGMAESIGPATTGLQDLQAAAISAYTGPLGNLGMSLEQVTGDFSALAAAMQYTNVVGTKDLATITMLHRSFGLTADEMGNVLRANKFMNISLEQQKKDMFAVAGMANKYRINVKGLSKDVFVAGKNLMDMAGPTWRASMVESIAKVRAMGISVQALEKFTDMTDVFDSTVESMAKLNTAFGLHIDALQMFDEQDPAKRLQMVSDQLRIQGKTYETMNRQQKKFLATQLGISMEETNALLQGKDMVESMKEQEKVADTLESMMSKLRTSIANVAQFMDKMYMKIANGMLPFFKKLGLTVNFAEGKFDGFQQVLTKGADKLGEFIDKVVKQPAFIKAMEKLGDVVKKFFEWLDKPETQERFAKFIEKVVNNVAYWAEKFESVGEAASGLLGVLGWFTDNAGILWLSSAIMTIGSWIMKATNAVGGLGSAFSSVMGKIGSAAGTLWRFLKPIGQFLGMETAEIGATMGAAGAATAALGVGAAAMGGWELGSAMERNNTFGVNTGMQKAMDFVLGDASTAFSREQSPAARAIGGPVEAGIPYTVGESGRETFTPRTAGTITPSGGGNNQPILVQVILDGEVIQDKMYKANLRSG